MQPGRTVLHTILDNHFNSFVENYEVKYAEECGKYSLDRITAVVEEYLKCRMGTRRLTIS